MITLLEKEDVHSIHIPHLIFEEVRQNLSPEAFGEFNDFINAITVVDEDYLIPFEIGAKYEKRGLKDADALIAAYTEWVDADVLVSENRHFLTLPIDLPFKILTAKKCLKII